LLLLRMQRFKRVEPDPLAALEESEQRKAAP
jgi:hypothetical protein